MAGQNVVAWDCNYWNDQRMSSVNQLDRRQGASSILSLSKCLLTKLDVFFSSNYKTNEYRSTVITCSHFVCFYFKQKH